MAHFAQLDENGIVLQVLVVSDEDTKNEQGQESEQAGIDFLKGLLGEDTIWKQTSYNTVKGVHGKGRIPFRKNYAGIGYQYDIGRDAFIPPKPFDSWLLDESKGTYEPPYEQPNNGKRHRWNESTKTWDER
jgi:hypothetical protein